jgi:hypothetical protein
MRLLAVIVCLCAAIPAGATTGVALVHGTGAQTNAASDYWTWEFVNTVRDGLSDRSELRGHQLRLREVHVDVGCRRLPCRHPVRLHHQPWHR